MTVNLYNGNCLDVLKTFEENSIDACVTDPPYGLSFMGKSWDYDVPKAELWKEVYRSLRPGAHILAFFGSRTYHRGVVQIEDAGFEIRDQIMWVYGSGFPKSHNVSKTISASQWEGWGTALKPAHEPIVLARKPIKTSVAENVLKYGTGALNIDDCRVGDEVRYNTSAKNKAGGNNLTMSITGMPSNIESREAFGRWPANFIHDGSSEVVELFPDTKSGTLTPDMNISSSTGWSGGSSPNRVKKEFIKNAGSAARFFYCAKASKKDRDEGLETSYKNNHPTVKPTELMRYLCRLITPPNGVILDPFMGSGSTGKAARLENFGFVGIELDENYCRIAEQRIENVKIKSTLNKYLE